MVKGSQFSSEKQQSLEVKGYDGGESIPRPKPGQAMTGELQWSGSRILPRQFLAGSVQSDAQRSGEVVVARGEQPQDHQNLNLVSSVIVGNVNSNKMDADFKGILQDIDKAISIDKHTPDPVVLNIIQDIAGKNQIVTWIQRELEISELRETNADPKNTQHNASVDFGVGLGDSKQG